MKNEEEKLKKIQQGLVEICHRLFEKISNGDTTEQSAKALADTFAVLVEFSRICVEDFHLNDIDYPKEFEEIINFTVKNELLDEGLMTHDKEYEMHVTISQKIDEILEQEQIKKK